MQVTNLFWTPPPHSLLHWLHFPTFQPRSSGDAHCWVLHCCSRSGRGGQRSWIFSGSLTRYPVDATQVKLRPWRPPPQLILQSSQGVNCSANVGQRSVLHI